MSQPHILFLVADSLRADKFFSAVQNSQLDAAKLIRERAVSFENFYAVASTTTPCFGSILTGLYPTRNGLRAHRGDKLGQHVHTVAHWLRQAGYQTAAHVTGPLGPETDLQRGFDLYDFRNRHETEYTAFASRVRKRLRALQQSQRPWFELVHFWLLHRTRRYSFLYRSLMRSESGWWQNSASLLDGLLSRAIQWQNAERTYDRSLEALLFYLDLLLLELDLDRTVVVIMGDHGEFIGAAHDKYPSHNFFPANRDHAFHVSEFLVKIPFVVLAPEVKSAVSVMDLCSQVDIAPTLLDLAEYRVLSDFQGFSLRPRFGGQRLPDRPIFFEAVGGKSLQPEKLISGVRFDRWKYVCAPHSTAFPSELFDLQADPHEETNLAARQPEVVARARSLLEAHYNDSLSPEARVKMTPEEEAVVTERLKDLGYIE